MPVIVVMIVIMPTAVVQVLVEIIEAHVLVGDLGEFEDVVHHFVLEDRRAEFRQGLRRVAVEVVDLPLLTRELADAFDQRLIDLVVRDRDFVRRSDLREQKAEPDPPLGDAAILFLGLLLGRALVLERPLRMFEVVHHLIPDRVELVLHEGRREFEIVSFVEGVEQGTLHLQARSHVAIELKAPLYRLAHLGDGFGAEALGEVVVECRGFRRGDFLDFDFKRNGLTGELRLAIFFGEGRVDDLLFAGLHAHQALFEARDEAAGSERNRCVRRGAALESLAVELADEIDRDAVALLRSAVFRLVGLVGGEDALNRLVDVLVRNRRRRTFEGDRAEIHHVHLRKDLEGHRVG